MNADQPEHATSLSPIMAWINELMPSILFQNVVACILTFLQAVYINRIVVKHRMGSEPTLWPGLVYILLCSLLPHYTYLSAVLIANTFILVAFSDIFKIYKRPFVVKFIFNSGVFISVAAMIYPPYITYLLAGFIGLAIIRSFKTKEVMQYICGLSVPFILYGTWSYYRSVFQENMNGLWQNQFGFPANLIPNNTNGYIHLALILLPILIAIFSYGNYSMKKSIQVQKKIDILFWMIASSMIALFINDNLTHDHLLMLAIPLGILLSMNLLKIKSAIIPELIHLSILILIGLVHFGVLAF